MRQLRQDIRYGFRQLLRSPGFTATAITTLALGIGANTAVFTLLYGLLLRPLPVSAPDELYRLGDTFTCCSYTGLTRDGDFDIFSYGNYLHLRKAIPEFQGLAAIEAGPPLRSVKRGRDTPRSLIVAEVSGNYFQTYGVTAFLGKLFEDADDQPNAEHVAVINYDAWKTEFSGDPGIVGTKILIQSTPFRVIGIAQRGFFGERVTDRSPAFWVPLASEAPFHTIRLPMDDIEWLWLVVRLRPGTDIGTLQSKTSDETRRWLTSLSDLSPRYKARIPQQHVVLTQVATGIQNQVSGYRPGLKLLLILSSVALLIACANIANLLLARGTARRDYLAIRMALGASRGRIIRQIFTENLLLSCIGGIVALAFAFAGSYVTLLLGFPEATTLPVPATPSIPVLGFAFLVSVLTGLLFAAAPARLSMLAEPAQVMRGSLHFTRGLSQLPQKGLLFLQAALCVVLLTVAILATRSLFNLTHQPLGFDPTNRYVLEFDPLSSSYPADRLPELYAKMESRFSQLGGVVSAGLVANVPFDGNENSACILIKMAAPDGRLTDSAVQCGVAENQANAPYFDAMGIGILRGRNFSPQDVPTSTPVAIVSQSFAKRFFPNQNPLGRHFERSREGSSHTWEIVGVFPDIKIGADYTELPTYYVAGTQPNLDHEPIYMGWVVLHSNHPLDDADGMLRRTMSRVDPDLPVSSLHTMDAMIGNTLSQQRVTAWVSIVFGILAVGLATVGLYGVATYIVVQRTHEIGIRMALGSTRWGVINLVLRSVLVPVALGLGFGIPCSLLAGYGMKSLLYRIPWYDPFGLIAALLLLAVCAVAAGVIPARRAASIQPMQTLRVE
jgi:macrolide transport system ATP-binding/permease protein